MLTAETDDIADADGLGAFSYQWQADGADIAEATDSSYTLTADDLGKRISVRVRFTDDANNSESRTSEATAGVTAANTPATGQPTISGTPRVGQTLTAEADDIADADGLGAFSYQWQADGADIAEATDSSYTLTADDLGKRISVRVRFTDDGGSEETVTSEATAGGTAANTPATGQPTISGTPRVGQTLTAEADDIADADGLGAFSYQWKADGADIAEATDSSYTLTADDLGKRISVRVRFTDDGGSEETVTSEATAAINKLLQLQASFAQAEYQAAEGGQPASINVNLSPAADRRVEVPLVVKPQGGATSEDYSGVPASLVFEEGEDQGTISVSVLADEVNDPGEAIVLSFGDLPEAVSPGDPSTTQVNFNQRRTAEQFLRSLEVMLAVIARSMAESATTAIEGRFERHRQWSRLEPSGGAMQPLAPGIGETARGGELPSSHSRAGLGPRTLVGGGAEEIEGSVSRGESPVNQGSGGAAPTKPATGSGWDSASQQRGAQGSWLRNFSPGGLAMMACSGQSYSGFSNGYGTGGNRRDCGQDGFGGSGIRDSSLRPASTEFSSTRNQELNLAGASFELALGGQQTNGKGKSWGPVLWGQGDLQYFNGNLTRLGMNYRGGLNAAHVGLDLYANDKVLAGLSFMRSWGNMDYTDDGVDGVLDSGLNTFHPYLYWQPHQRFSAWVIGGVGKGGVQVNEPGRSHDFNADFRMLSGGMRSVLSKRGNTELGVVVDYFTASLGTDALDDIARVRGDARRTRMMLELVHDKALSPGRSLSVKVEVGGRHDEGDADRGKGVESGFRLGFLDANSGLDVALLGRTLVVHEGDYRDWGVGVQASWDPGEKQRGFRVSVTSSRGQAGQGRTTLWNNSNAITRPMGMGAMGMGFQSRMESEVAYGMDVFGGRGLLTPYSRLQLAGYGRALRVGTELSLLSRWLPEMPARFHLEGMRRETPNGRIDLGMMLGISIPF